MGKFDTCLNQVKNGLDSVRYASCKGQVSTKTPVYVDNRFVKAKSAKDFNFNSVGKSINVGASLSDNSRTSEAYSGHVMAALLNTFGVKASLFKSEDNISYLVRNCKKTDYLLAFDKDLSGVKRLAVEVKRISSFGGFNDVTDGYVFKVMDHANAGALDSNNKVHPDDRWDTQVLHVLTDNSGVVSAVCNWCDTVKDCGFSWVFVTVVNGNSKFVF